MAAFLLFVLAHPFLCVGSLVTLGVLGEWQKDREKKQRHAELLDAVRAGAERKRAS